MRQHIYTIEPHFDGYTVAKYLKEIHGYSSRALTKLRQIPDGLALNGRHIRTVDPVAAGDRLTVVMRDPDSGLAASGRSVDILYEDSDVVVFNKPPAMPCHPSRGHPDDTLANVFAARYGRALTFRALNRLDGDTTGCVLVCKNRYAASRLTGCFTKVYIGLVHGAIEEAGTVKAPIYRPIPFHIIRTVDSRGQYAATRYRPLAWGWETTLLAFGLLTGRTHQIRVHMSYIGRPLVGDALYGGVSSILGRQALHCRSVSFAHPVTGRETTVTAPLFEDMGLLLAREGIFQDGGSAEEWERQMQAALERKQK